MRKIITISTRALSRLLSVRTSWTKTQTLALFATLLSLGFSYAASGQCTSMSLSNATPPWNGLEFCDTGTGYDPTTIQAPIINYVGTCTNPPQYNYQWQYRINFGAWTTVNSGVGSPTVPSYNPPNQVHSGGSGPENFQWRILVQDVANGISAQSGNFTVIIGKPLILSLTSVNPTCFGGTNGSINLTVNGGTTPSFLWSNAATTEDLSGLGAGTYSVTVSDAACPSANTSTTLTAPSAVTVSAALTTAIPCFGGTGVVTVSASGGTAPYNAPVVGSTYTVNAIAGTYTYTVTDANACTGSTTFTVTQPNSRVHNYVRNTHFCTIQEGIDDVNTVDGDTIDVDPGTYPELVTVNKELMIRGPKVNMNSNTRFAAFTSGVDGPKADPTIEAIVTPPTSNPLGGNPGANDLFRVTKNNVTINGFVIDGNNPSIAGASTLQTGTIDIDARRGITNIDNSNGFNPLNNLKIRYNVIQNISQRGISLANNGPVSTGDTISNNVIRNFGSDPVNGGQGIILFTNAYADVINNTVDVSDNNIGLHLQNFFSNGTMTWTGNNVTVGQDAIGIHANLFYAANATLNINSNTVNAASAVTGASDYTWGINLWSVQVGSTVSLLNNIVGSSGGEFARGINLWNLPTTNTVNVTGGTVGNSVLGVNLDAVDIYFGAGSTTTANLVGTTITSGNGQTGIQVRTDVVNAVAPTGSATLNVSGTTVNATGSAIAASVVAPASSAPNLATLNLGGSSILNGGTTGLSVNGAQTALTGNTLNNTSFSGQTGNYITLANTALDNLVINATACLFDGSLGSAKTLAQNFAAEDKIMHAQDNSSLGFILVKSGEDFVTPNSASIQRGVDDATSGFTVYVAAGTYTENVIINKSLSLFGPNQNNTCFISSTPRVAEAIIVGSGAGSAAVTIAANAVAIWGFEITNPSGNNAITTTDKSSIQIINNVIHDIGNNATTGNTHAIHYAVGSATNSGYLVQNNCIDNIYGGGAVPALTSGTGSASGVGFTQNSSAGVLSFATVSQNKITNIFANTNLPVSCSGGPGGSKGAYGILLGVGGSGGGSISNATIQLNTIQNLSGYWAHGIGLEGNTPLANVNLNLVDNLTSTKPVSCGGPDAVAVKIETNNAATSILINNNSFTNSALAISSALGTAVNASCNWYGSAASGTIAPQIVGLVNYSAWLVSGASALPSGFPGFSPTGACTGTPIVIASAAVTPTSCGVTGTSNVVFTDGTSPYTVSWSGAASGSQTAAASPSNITGLVFGNYTVTITDANGSTATTAIVIGYAGVKNITQNTLHTTIQGANDAATTMNGDVIEVCAGTYAENVNITKELTLNGPNANVACTGTRGAEAIVTGSAASPAITINANNVTINGFEVTNTFGYMGISNSGRSNVNVGYNNINDIGDNVTGTITTGSFGIHMEAPSTGSASNIRFHHNCISDVRGSNGGASGTRGSGVGIGLTSSNSTTTITGVVIDSNSISNISAFAGTGGKGAYGIFNNVSNGSGVVNGLEIKWNTIDGLNGNWATALSLAGKTPSAIVTNNDVKNLSSTNGALGAYVEGNPNAATILINNNSFTAIAAPGAGVYNNHATDSTDATCNWYGSAVAATVAANNPGRVKYITWLTSGTDANGAAVGFQPTMVCNGTPVILTETHTNVSCNAGTNGTIDLSVTGGTGAGTYTYAWTPGSATSQDTTGLTAGTYTVLVTDANGSTASTAVTITEPSALGATTAITHLTCSGVATGSYIVTPTGGTPTYTVSGTFTGLAAGTHTYSVTDANGCTFNGSVTITEPVTVVASVDATSSVSCFGGSNGTATVTASGGTPPYSFNGNSPNNGPTSNIYSGLTAGTHTFTVTDGNGCSSTVTAMIGTPLQLVATATVTTPVACTGGSAIVTVSATGGTLSYTGTGTFTAVASVTTYTYNVTDANGCAASAQVTVTEPSVVNVTAMVTTPIACNGGSGMVTVSATGGTTPYGSGIGSFPASVGTHTYTVTDANGCTGTAVLTITQPSAITNINIAVTPISCFGLNNGVAVVSGVTGGTQFVPAGLQLSYNYLWSTGGNGTTENLIAPGTHTLTVTDANGCSAQQTFTMTQPTLLTATTSVVNHVNCNGDTTGKASVTIAGGTPFVVPPTYMISWSSGGTLNLEEELWAGTHTVTVTDSKGCIATNTVTITQATAITVAVSQTNVSCFGGSNGSYTVTPSGGTPTYTVTGTFTGLSAGTHSYTVTDANGCIKTGTVTISQPPTAVSATTAQTNVSCFGGSNGSFTVTPSGGTGAHTVAGTFSGLAAGTHTYSVTDANGCVFNSSVVITEPLTAVSATTAQTNVNCFGGSTGSFTVTPSGGTGAHTLAGTFSGLAAGTHTYSVTDANGCVFNGSVTITEPTSAVTATTAQTDVLCFGASTSSFTVTPSGGTPSYTVSGTFSGLAQGTHTYSVSDANGCVFNGSVTISQPATAVSATTAQTDVLCFGGSTGSFTVTPSGGTGALTVAGTFSGLATGSHTYSVTDANGCVFNGSVTITAPATAVSATTAQTNVSCFGGSNGSFTVTPSGGTGAHTVAGTFTGLAAGTHTYSVTDANGCVFNGSVNISEPGSAVTATTAQTNVSCFGGSNGSFTVTPSGGTGAHTVAGTFSGLAAGTHTYSVTDANGCVFNGSVNISEPASAVTATTAQTDVLCFGGSNGSFTVTPSGGTGAHTVAGTFSGLAAGTHTYSVTDANGCVFNGSVTIGQPSSAVSATTAQTNVTCFGGSTGSFTVTPSGGTGAHTVAGTFSGLAAGTHTYSVTDANGCVFNGSVILTQSPAITASTSPDTCDSYTWNMVTYTTSGVHTATFTAANGCDSVHTINLTIRNSSSSTQTVSASLSYTWAATGLTYTVSNTYTTTITNVAGCDSVATLNLTIVGVAAVSKVYLCGPYIGGGLMHDSLRAKGALPTSHPYVGGGFAPMGGPATETVSPATLAITGSSAVVDWVMLEIRDTALATNYQVLANERGLLLANGNIVSESGSGPVVFPTIAPGMYRLSVRHRNHLSVMTAGNYAFTLAGVTVDFSTAPLWTKITNPLLVNTPAKVVSGVQVLWPGDANVNKNTKYNGFQNDKDEILNGALGGNPLLVLPNISSPLTPYRAQDVNMDGVIRYNGLNNDRNFILSTLGVATPNNIYNQHTP